MKKLQITLALGLFLSTFTACETEEIEPIQIEAIGSQGGGVHGPRERPPKEEEPDWMIIDEEEGSEKGKGG